MKVIPWGTRGSIAISNKDSVAAGGNTTCFEIVSECLPANDKLMVDAGTGLVPAAQKYLGDFINGNSLSYTIFFTHYHYDHILGLTLAPPTFINQIPMRLFGPVDEGISAKDMVEVIFKRPFFPVDDKYFRHKIKFKALVDYDVHVVAVHPNGGYVTYSLDKYNAFLKADKHLPMGQGKTYPVSECMIITMAKTNHGNANCISYRFEEKPTGKVLVICTDHEDMAGISMDFRRHLSGADLLIIDAQYSQAKYVCTAGFGHGTPFGCVKHAIICGVKKLALTHHDPASTDKFLAETILKEAVEAVEVLSNYQKMLDIYKVKEIILKPENIILCLDYREINV